MGGWWSDGRMVERWEDGGVMGGWWNDGRMVE